MGQLHVQAGDDDQPAPKHPVDGVFRHRGAGQAADAEAHAGHVVELRADGAGAEDADLHLTAGPAEFLGDGLGQSEDIGLGGVIGGEQGPGRKAAEEATFRMWPLFRRLKSGRNSLVRIWVHRMLISSIASSSSRSVSSKGPKSPYLRC